MELGITIDVILMQFWNALLPIEVNESPIETDTKLGHSANAYSPIDVAAF